MRKLTLIFCLFFCVSHLFSGQYDDLPKAPESLIIEYDNAKIFSKLDKEILELKLRRIDNTHQLQMVIVSIDDLLGYEASDLAERLLNYWKVGHKENQGVLFLVKPTGNKGQRKTWISTGYGLEAELPDYICGKIRDDLLVPNFKNGNFYKGFDKSIDKIVDIVIDKNPYKQEVSYGVSNDTSDSSEKSYEELLADLKKALDKKGDNEIGSRDNRSFYEKYETIIWFIFLVCIQLGIAIAISRSSRKKRRNKSKVYRNGNYTFHDNDWDNDSSWSSFDSSSSFDDSFDSFSGFDDGAGGGAGGDW